MDDILKPPHTVAERLEYIMQTRKLRQVDIIAMAQPYCMTFGVNLQKNDLSQYLHGKSNPKQDKCFILAMTLNVSEPWLMGYDVPMERTVMPIEVDVDGLEKEAMELFRELSPEKKALVVQMIRGLLNS